MALVSSFYSGEAVFSFQAFRFKSLGQQQLSYCYYELEHPLFLLLFFLRWTFPLCLQGENYGPAIKGELLPTHSFSLGLWLRWLSASSEKCRDRRITQYHTDGLD